MVPCLLIALSTGVFRKGQFWVHCYFYSTLTTYQIAYQVLCPESDGDDTHLTFASEDINIIDEAFNRELDLVNNWLISNKLTFNTIKTALC